MPSRLLVARNQSVETTSSHLSWAEIECSADVYAPPGTETEEFGLEHPPKLVNCRLDELRPHPSYVRHGLRPSAAQLFALAAIGESAFRDPIHVTSNGLILDGYTRFELARRQKRKTVLCLEYALSEEEALRWLIQRHRPSQSFSAFDRALLALDLEPSLQEAAGVNQQWGGQNKGSPSLSEAQTVNVRSKVAATAGVSSGTLDKVRKVKSADPKIREATSAGEISVHKASLWCRLPAHEQLKELEKYRSGKGVNKTSRRLIQKHVKRFAPSQPTPWNLASLLKPFVPNRSSALDSIVVTEIDAPGKIAYFTKDALRTLRSMEEQNGKRKLDGDDSGIPGCLASTENLRGSAKELYEIRDRSPTVQNVHCDDSRATDSGGALDRIRDSV
jgi:hypothetical protein